MTFKRYLSIDQAIAYLSENQPFNSKLEDLQELERFGQIKPLIYLSDVLFSKDITFNDFDGDRILRGEVSAVSGYFKPSDFIFLDRYTLNPYREFQDEYFELKLFDSLEIEHLTSNSDKLSKGDKGTISGVKGFSDQLVTEIPCELVFISRIELDALLSSEIKEDDKTINELNQRIKQLEQQLEQSSLSKTNNINLDIKNEQVINSLKDDLEKLTTENNTLKQQISKQVTMPADDKELSPKSEAKVVDLVYTLLSMANLEHELTVGGKGNTNLLIETTSKKLKTPLSNNFIATWLKKAYQLHIKDLEK